MSEDIVKIETSENILEDLIHGLKMVHQKLSTDDRITLTIDFNKGVINTYVHPREDDNFKIEF